MEISTKYVAYYRVSTQKQNTTGLGLDAQRKTILDFVKSENNILCEFIEVESGKNVNRKELEKALLYAKENKATLIVAKLDRLARNVEFIFKLKDSGIEFKACDLSDFNTLTIGIFATMAQYEREIISKRTKDALQVRKTQLAKEGKKLGEKGKENLLKSNAYEKGLQVRQQNAKEAKENIQAIELSKMYKEKGMNLQQIASKLNENGYKTRRGKSFSPTHIFRFLQNATNENE